VAVDVADAVTSTTCARNDGLTATVEWLSVSGVEVAPLMFTPNGDLCTKTAAGVTWAYAYGGAGLLREVKERSMPLATFFVYGLGLDPIWEKAGTTETRHVYANGLRIARIVVGGSTYYVHADALG